MGGSAFEAFNVGKDSSITDAYKRTNAAKQLAPRTRRLWEWILFCEGAAVLLPMFWLLVIHLRWTPAYGVCGVGVHRRDRQGACWWMRWPRHAADVDLPGSWQRCRAP